MYLSYITGNFGHSFGIFTIDILLNPPQPSTGLFTGSLESANSSILAAQRFFKEVVGGKISIYVN